MKFGGRKTRHYLKRSPIRKTQTCWEVLSVNAYQGLRFSSVY